MCSNYGEDEVDYDTINLMSPERNSFSNLANTKPISKTSKTSLTFLDSNSSH